MGYDDVKKMWLKHELIMQKLQNYGDIYFQDATNGLNTNHGTTPLSPFKDLEYAVAQLTDGHNDVIIHKGLENVSTYVDLDKEKMSLFGWGLFGANPSFPEIGSIYRSAKVNMPVLNITADFVEIAGLAFAAEWVTDDAEGQGSVGVNGGANKTFIHHCFFTDWNYASNTAGLMLGGPHYTVIEDCEFESVWGNMDDGIVIGESWTGSGTDQPAHTRIRRCNFAGMGTGGSAMTNGIQHITGCTHQNWMIEDCNFMHVTTAVRFVTGALLWAIIRDCVGSMSVGTFCVGSETCDTIANAKTNYEVILANIWGSGAPLTA